MPLAEPVSFVLVANVAGIIFAPTINDGGNVLVESFRLNRGDQLHTDKQRVIDKAAVVCYSATAMLRSF